MFVCKREGQKEKEVYFSITNKVLKKIRVADMPGGRGI